MDSFPSNRPYLCRLCGKKVHSMSALQQHTRIHRSVYPYQCSICSKSFHVLDHLRKHQVLHDHEKPLTCSWCSMSFLEQYQLGRHLFQEHRIICNNMEPETEDISMDSNPSQQNHVAMTGAFDQGYNMAVETHPDSAQSEGAPFTEPGMNTERFLNNCATALCENANMAAVDSLEDVTNMDLNGNATESAKLLNSDGDRLPARSVNEPCTGLVGQVVQNGMSLTDQSGTAGAEGTRSTTTTEEDEMNEAILLLTQMKDTCEDSLNDGPALQMALMDNNQEEEVSETASSSVLRGDPSLHVCPSREDLLLFEETASCSEEGEGTPEARLLDRFKSPPATASLSTGWSNSCSSFSGLVLSASTHKLSVDPGAASLTASPAMSPFRATVGRDSETDASDEIDSDQEKADVKEEEEQTATQCIRVEKDRLVNEVNIVGSKIDTDVVEMDTTEAVKDTRGDEMDPIADDSSRVMAHKESSISPGHTEASNELPLQPSTINFIKPSQDSTLGSFSKVSTANETKPVVQFETSVKVEVAEPVDNCSGVITQENKVEMSTFELPSANGVSFCSNGDQFRHLKRAVVKVERLVFSDDQKPVCLGKGHNLESRTLRLRSKHKPESSIAVERSPVVTVKPRLRSTKGQPRLTGQPKHQQGQRSASQKRRRTLSWDQDGNYRPTPSGSTAKAGSASSGSGSESTTEGANVADATGDAGSACLEYHLRPKRRKNFHLLQEACDCCATVADATGDAGSACLEYHLRPKRRKNFHLLQEACDCCVSPRKGTDAGLSVTQSQNYKESMAKVISLRRQVVQLMRTVFPEIKYPARFRDDGYGVEYLMDEVMDAVSDHGHRKPQYVPFGDVQDEVRVLLCKHPRGCLRHLRKKTVKFLNTLLPDIPSDGLEPSGVGVELLLAEVVETNLRALASDQPTQPAELPQSQSPEPQPPESQSQQPQSG